MVRCLPLACLPLNSQLTCVHLCSLLVSWTDRSFFLSSFLFDLDVVSCRVSTTTSTSSFCLLSLFVVPNISTCSTAYPSVPLLFHRWLRFFFLNPYKKNYYNKEHKVFWLCSIPFRLLIPTDVDVPYSTRRLLIIIIIALTH